MQDSSSLYFIIYSNATQLLIDTQLPCTLHSVYPNLTKSAEGYNVIRNAQEIEEDNSHPKLQKALEIIWIIVAVFGFTLNTAQIFWILSHHRKSVIEVFIFSLSVVDLQTCCFNIPFQVAELFYNFNWSALGAQAQLACKFHWYFKHGSIVSGSVMISLIAVSRYIAISHPMMIIKERCSQMCINCVLATITWIGTVCLVAPLASITATINVKYVKDTTYNIKDTALACLRKVELCEQEETSLVPEIYGSALFYIVPLIVMSVSYSSLIRILVKRKHNKALTYRGNSKHFNKSIVNSLLGLAYIMLVSPKGIYDIFKIARYITHETTTEDDKYTELILYALATTVVLSNPIIYSFVTARFLKFVEQHSPAGSINRHAWNGSLHSIWTKIDWNRKLSAPFFHHKPFLSHEELYYDLHESPRRCYSRQETIKTIVMFETEDPETSNSVAESNENLLRVLDKSTKDKKEFKRVASTGRLPAMNELKRKYATL